MPTLPTMFIGSSSDRGLVVARALQAELEDSVDSTIWSQGVFGLGSGTLESLIDVVRAVQFATLVLTPDDLITKRGRHGNAPRDNVVFEVGYFMGALGRGRTFLVACRDDHLDLPSDLAGVAIAQYKARENLQAALGPAAHKIRLAIEVIQPSLAVSSPSASAAAPPDMESVSRLAGGLEILIEQLRRENPRLAVTADYASLFNEMLRRVNELLQDDALVAAIRPLRSDAGARRDYGTALKQLETLRAALGRNT